MKRKTGIVKVGKSKVERCEPIIRVLKEMGSKLKRNDA
jgi:hypothetical protein